MNIIVFSLTLKLFPAGPGDKKPSGNGFVLDRWQAIIVNNVGLAALLFND